MSRQLGTGHIHTLGTVVVGCAALSGYVTPNVQSLRATHVVDADRIKSSAGIVTGVIGEDDGIECTFEVIPEGTTIAQAIADSKKAAGLPTAPSAFTITGLPIIACGPFSDAFNTNGTSTQPWIYEGGGSWNGVNDGKWTMTLPLRRYQGITSGTAAS